MCAAKSRGPLGILTRLLGRITSPLRALTGSGNSLKVVVPLTLGFLVIIGLWAAWMAWGPSVTSSSEYQLSVETIKITEPPPWIRADIRAQVFRDASLAGVSLRDRQLTVKVARAFEGHPWVARVTRVRKRFPAEVDVELVYRRPVAMVEVFTGDQPGLFPIDSEGVLLDPRDFSENMALQYLRIVVDYSHPLGVVGTSWGDQRVISAAQIAGLLGSIPWKEMGIYRVVALPDAGGTSTSNGTVPGSRSVFV